MWLPTPDGMVKRMLEAAKTTGRDIVYDLGAGEGRIPIAAAKAFGARAVGIEYDPALAALARRNAARAGVADRVTIIEGDIFKEDFSAATVVTLYLLPDLNQQLRPQMLRMKPGTRVVSHIWDMGEWEPDEAIRSSETEAFLWIVPGECRRPLGMARRGRDSSTPRSSSRSSSSASAARSRVRGAHAAAARRVRTGRSARLHLPASGRRRAPRARARGRRAPRRIAVLRRQRDTDDRPARAMSVFAARHRRALAGHSWHDGGAAPRAAFGTIRSSFRKLQR